MLSATTSIANPDLAQAAGHVRAALERAGVEDLFLTKSKDGFVARGIRGRSTAAALAASTPLAWTGHFSRIGVQLRCRRSLDKGDDSLRLTLRVQALREFEDVGESDWVTRGPAEMLGDSLQTKRALRQLMDSLCAPTDAGPEGFGTEPAEDPAARRAAFQERYRRGKTRRRWQVAGFAAVVVLMIVVRSWMDGLS